MATSEQPSEYVVILIVEALHFSDRRNPDPEASWSIPQIKRIATRPNRPKACTESPATEPPARATFTVSPIDKLSLALLDVLTFANVALFIPVMQAALEAKAPKRSVRPDVFSTKRENIRATINTTMNIVLYSVFINVLAPLRIMAAISTISSVPSFIALILL